MAGSGGLTERMIARNRRAVPREVHGGGRFVLERKELVPAYLRTWERRGLRAKVEEALDALRECALCPRNCHVDRLRGRFAVCRTGRRARASAAFPHFGEEDVLRGWSGSGTIFFGWCNLRCVFCQNWETSQIGEGEDVGPEGLARMMVTLQARGCHNINLVTPEHVVPQALEALPYAIDAGLTLPIVYNTSAYDGARSLELMDGVVDLYMPDFKVWDRERARRLLLAPDYPDAARHAIQTMHAQVGPLVVDEDGLALRGVLVRHLVMPGMLRDTGEILRWLAALSPDTYLNLMDQYAPAWKATADVKHADIARAVETAEMDEARSLARAAGLWRLDTRWRDPWQLV